MYFVDYRFVASKTKGEDSFHEIPECGFDSAIIWNRCLKHCQRTAL
jgi:hypothetical protein